MPWYPMFLYGQILQLTSSWSWIVSWSCTMWWRGVIDTFGLWVEVFVCIDGTELAVSDGDILFSPEHDFAIQLPF